DDVNLFEGNVNSAILDYPLPETATYSILVSRYDGELGFTVGEFTLNLSTSNGGSSTPPPTETSELVYNSSAEGSLDNNQYEARYTFVGASGDHITIDLISISGNLDPYLVLIAPDGEIVAENDDSDITTRNAAIL